MSAITEKLGNEPPYSLRSNWMTGSGDPSYDPHEETAMYRLSFLLGIVVMALAIAGCGRSAPPGSSATSSPTGESSTEGAGDPNAVPDNYYTTVPEDETRISRIPVELALSNPEFVDRKYALREIELTGVVVKQGRDESSGEADTVWLGPAAAKSSTNVACRLHDASSLNKLSVGKAVTIRGRLQRDMAQSLGDCEIVE